MNLLQKYIQENGLNEVVCMNFLQGNGVFPAVISDNCVTAADVPDSEFPVVREYLVALVG